MKIMAKVTSFNNPEIFIDAPLRYDVYIMDMDSKNDALQLGVHMKKIDAGSHFIFISSNVSLAYSVTKAKMNYFLEKPLIKEEFIDTLKEIKQKIQHDNIVIKIPSGERRVRANLLNYINIEKRCLCYHLADGTMFDGQTLRTSFKNAISPLDTHKAFLFLAPSLLINVGEIKILNSDNIVFESGDILFFPKKQYDTVREAWIKYSRILD